MVVAEGTEQLQELSITITQWAERNRCEVNNEKTKIVEVKKTAPLYPLGEIISGYVVGFFNK